jgi:threonine dehydratase
VGETNRLVVEPNCLVVEPVETSHKVAHMDVLPLAALADIEAAREELHGISIETPMEESRWLSAVSGGPVLLKCENLQRTGSFKIRGAYTRMSRLSPEERAAGVVAASAGNHAQGVALAAQMLGINATVFMPAGATIPKEKATRGYGADVRFHGTTIDEALIEACKLSAETGAVLIHPFDHKDIVAGQGTCGLEILEQCPGVKTVLVPTGGGGFLAGIATAVKAKRPDVRVVGIQAKGAAAYVESLTQGRPVALDAMATMADGIAVGRPGQVPFRAIQEYVDDIITVSEESLSRALLMLLERAKMVVEPAGAAAVAAMLDDSARFDTPAVAVLSGGNVDPLLLMKVIRHGMAAAGRYLYFRVRIPDLPGGLAQLLAELAELEANVLDVMHERTSAHLHLDEVEVAMQVETRGVEHAHRVLTRLRKRGYRVSE